MSWISHFDRAAASNLDFRVMRPAASLRPFVRYYWTLKSHGPSPSLDEYLAPDGFEELIFTYGGRYRRTEINGTSGSQDTLDRSYLVGCKTVGVNCLRLSDLSMVGVKLWPNALFSLLGIPLSQMRGRPVNLQDLGVAKLREIETRVYDASSENQIKAILDQLLRPEEFSRRASELVGFSVRSIFAARGDIGIDAILRPAGRHYRTAERAFQERVGVSPKQLAKVVRFKHAFTTLNRQHAQRRGAISPMDFGYYDASHFAKDFRAFTGSSPARFLRGQNAVSLDIYRFCLDVDLHRLDTREAERGFAL